MGKHTHTITLQWKPNDMQSVVSCIIHLCKQAHNTIYIPCYCLSTLITIGRITLILPSTSLHSFLSHPSTCQVTPTHFHYLVRIMWYGLVLETVHTMWWDADPSISTPISVQYNRTIRTNKVIILIIATDGENGNFLAWLSTIFITSHNVFSLHLYKKSRQH